MRTNRWNTPYKVLNNPKDFRDYAADVVIKNGQKESRYSHIMLVDKFNKVLQDPLIDGGYTYLLSCDYNYVIPELAAKAVEDKVLEMGRLPYWYNVVRNHRSQDEYLNMFISESGLPDLLIIDGLFAKTNINNVDKVRELLDKFEDTPIYIIISGGYGPEVFKQVVFAPFNRFIHFGDTPGKEDIYI